MVETGYEKTVARLLSVQKLGKTLYPQRVRIRRFRNVWHRDRIRLLPGYVFVYLDEEVPVRYYQGIEHVLKVLRYDREPDGYLKGMDLDFANTISELDGRLDILNAVDEAGFIRVTDKLLKTLNGEVLSVDRRKRLVKIRIHLMGMARIIYMNYQLLDDNGNPLSPAEEMVDDETDEWLTSFTPDFTDELAEELDREEALKREEKTEEPENLNLKDANPENPELENMNPKGPEPENPNPEEINPENPKPENPNP